MKTIFCIFKKELRSIIGSPFYYVIGLLFATFLSINYIRSLAQFQTMSMQGAGLNIHSGLFIPHLNSIYLIFLVVIPLLTMRLFAEEKRNHTFDLLLTAPITSSQIVIGKFLASWLSVLILLAIGLLYPLMTASVASFDWGPMWGSYLGMFWLAGVNVSIGMFASTLTASSVVCAFLGFLLILALMLLGSGAGQMADPFWSSLLDQLSLVTHLQSFFQGLFEIKGFVFMISCILLFSFMAIRMVESSRWR